MAELRWFDLKRLYDCFVFLSVVTDTIVMGSRLFPMTILRRHSLSRLVSCKSDPRISCSRITTIRCRSLPSGRITLRLTSKWNNPRYHSNVRCVSTHCRWLMLFWMVQGKLSGQLLRWSNCSSACCCRLLFEFGSVQTKFFKNGIHSFSTWRSA